MPIVTATPVAVFTAGFNVTGQPAISLPLHMSVEGLPIGVQLVAALRSRGRAPARGVAARGSRAVGRPHSADLRRRVGGRLAQAAARRPSARRRPRAWARPRRGRCASNRPARSHGLTPRAGAGGGAVSRRNCSIAAAIAAVSSGDGGAVAHLDARARRMPSRRCGSQGTSLPPPAAYGPPWPSCPCSPRHRPARGRRPPRRSSACATASSSTPAASGRCRRRCTSTRRRTATSGRCRPRARASRSSSGSRRFPRNPAAGLPVVMGVICVSSRRGRGAARAARRALGHRAAHRRGRGGGRTGARPRGRPHRRASSAAACTARGRPAAWRRPSTARASASTPTPRPPARLAGELGWEVGAREDALACDVVTCVTPGAEPVVRRGRPAPRPAPQHARRRRPRQGRGRRPRRWRACELFCDEWEQASHGGELTGAVAAGLVDREQVTQLGRRAHRRGARPLEPDGDHPVRQHRSRDPGPRASASRCSRPARRSAPRANGDPVGSPRRWRRSGDARSRRPRAG